MSARRIDRRLVALMMMLASLSLQGSSCPPEDGDQETISSAEAFGERVLLERSPVVVAEGTLVSVGIDFRSTRPDLFFSDYDVSGAIAGIATRLDEDRRGPGRPYLADLEIVASVGTAGIHDLVISAGQQGDEVEATLRLVVVPRAVGAIAGATAIDAGDFHTLAILGAGQVWAWGRNAEGQLGDGTRIDRVQPVRVVGLPRAAVAVSAGGAHSLALLDDGTVWAWGANDFRQLGAAENLDDRAAVNEPVPVECRDFRCEPALPTFVAIAAGRDHSLALTGDGVVWAWGRYGRGQLGRESFERRDGIAFPIGFPNDLSGIVNFVAIAAGDQFSLALEDDGRVWGWGKNDLGQLGDRFESAYAFPIELARLGPDSAVALAAGNDHAMVLTPEGTVLTAGSNTFGQLGDPNREFDGFLPVPQLRGVTAIAAGFVHSLALREDGTVFGWGSNAFDQLGFPERAPPAFETNPSLVQGIPLSMEIAAGGRHSLGISRDCPQIWGWGDNGVGQLGLGNAGRNGFAGRVLGVGDDAAETGLGDCGLPLSVAIDGAGSVASDVGQILCPEDLCSEIYDRGTRVRLTATAAEGHRFASWSGEILTAAPVLDLEIDRSRNVLARFVPDRRPPVAAFDFSPEAPVSGEPVTLDASASTDPDGEIVDYAWSSPDTLSLRGRGARFDYVFNFAGTYDVELTVTDDEGLRSTSTRSIVVGRRPADPPSGPATYTLEIVFAGGGSGRISLLGGELECTARCSFRLGAGEHFLIEAFADEGSFFSRFEGCDPAPETPANACLVDLDRDRTISVFLE